MTHFQNERHYQITWQMTDDPTWTCKSKEWVPAQLENKQLVADYVLTDFIRTNDLPVRVLRVDSLPCHDIDYPALERMRAVRAICELGNRVRADNKIRNRQPLPVAYITFLDQQINDYMLFTDNQKAERQYMAMIEDELNVDHVVYLSKQEIDQFFDYSFKPNFKSLGTKGLGKQAQGLKSIFAQMSAEERNAHFRVWNNGETVDLNGIEVSIDDILVEYSSKIGFASANGKVGAIVLDTTLNEHLLRRGFVADFRSEIQGIRKLTKLELTDRIYLEILCSKEREAAISFHKTKLCKDLLATDIVFLEGLAKLNEKIAHTVQLGEEKMFVHLFKEEGR